ncbi:IDEAL domain-containing protein [Staphylococcus cohnii]
MKHNTHVKYNTLESFVSTINDLGIELIIDESLRNVRKQQLENLIDHALKNKNENDFKRYTEEYKNLEAYLVV